MRLNSSIVGLVIIFLFGCVINKKVINNDEICMSNYKIKQGELSLNRDNFDLENLSSSPKTFFENDTFSKKISFVYNKYYVFKYNKHSSNMVWLSYNKDSLYLSSYQLFYKLDNSNLEIEKEKYFNSKGEITKIIDYRQKDKYPLCYKQALMLVDNWKPKDYEINHISRDSIVNNKGITYTWMVHIRHPVKARNEAKMYLYTIDAKTGKKLKKVETLLGTNDDL